MLPATPSSNASALQELNAALDRSVLASDYKSSNVRSDGVLSRLESLGNSSSSNLPNSSSGDTLILSPATTTSSSSSGTKSQSPLVRFGNRFLAQLGDSPVRVYKWTSKRASEVMQKLPTDRHKRCSVAVQILRNILTNPETKEIAFKYLESNTVVRDTVKRHYDRIRKESLEYRKQAVKKVLRVHSTKIKKNLVKHRAATRDLRKVGSLRQLSLSTGISKSSLQNISKNPVTESSRRICDEDRKRVIDFFHKNNITMQLPEKKRANHRYLRMTYDDAHREYTLEMKELKLNCLSLSSIKRILLQDKQFKYKKVGSIPAQSCQCKRCTNFALKRDALLAVGVRGLSRRTIDNLFECSCPPDPNRTKQCRRNLTEDISEAEGERNIMQLDRNCIFGFCSRCTNAKYEHKLVELNEKMDLRTDVSFKEWRYTKKDKTVCKWKGEGKDRKKEEKVVTIRDYTLVPDVKPLLELLSLWSTEAKQMALHYFNIKWQDKQFDQLLKNLKQGDVVMVMDFAQNLTHKEPVETQGAHWHRHQSALHPVVCYYVCSFSDCKKLIQHDIMCLSDDLKHDVVTVEAFETVALKVLQKNQVLATRVFQFCDNCAAQYKCSKAWASLSQREIPTMRNYFAPCHGKGPADGAIGRIVQLVDRDVKSHNVLAGIRNAQDFVSHCRSKYETLEGRATLHPEHYRRCFHYVPELSREEGQFTAGSIPGSMQLHCVRNVGDNRYLEVRLNSCFCRY